MGRSGWKGLGGFQNLESKSLVDVDNENKIQTNDSLVDVDNENKIQMDDSLRDMRKISRCRIIFGIPQGCICWRKHS
jgi:hypothetical protein